MMLRSEENVSWSRPTVRMSSKRTTDQKPASFGKSPSGLEVQRARCGAARRPRAGPVLPELEVADVEVGEVLLGCDGAHWAFLRMSCWVQVWYQSRTPSPDVRRSRLCPCVQQPCFSNAAFVV